MSTKFSGRKKARTYAMQALYSWRISNNNLNDIKMHILKDKNQSKVDLEHFDKLLFEIPESLNYINELITPYLDIEIEKLDPIELTILQIAAFELTKCLDIPYKVAINEALELCKTYGSQDSHKFVNGVLDKIASNLEDKS